METPLTDAEITFNTKPYYHANEIKVSSEFARELERDLRWLLIGTFWQYEDNILNFPVETVAVFEKWRPEILKMIGGK